MLTTISGSISVSGAGSATAYAETSATTCERTMSAQAGALGCGPHIDLGAWDGYVEGLARDGRITAGVPLFAKLYGAAISVQAGCLPHAGPTDDRGLQMVWAAGDHHLQVDIDANTKAEWFYLHLPTGRTAERSLRPDQLGMELMGLAGKLRSASAGHGR